MEFLPDFNLSKKLSHPLFETTSIGIMAFAWCTFAFSAKNYESESWYLWLLYSRVLSFVVGLFLIVYIIKKDKYYKNFAVIYLTYSIAVQASHGFLEGSSKTEFYNFTGLLFVLASLSFNGSFKKWVTQILPMQFVVMLLPLLTKDAVFFKSLSSFLDNFSLLVVGAIIGCCTAYLTSSRYSVMRKYLMEKEEKFNLARQVSHDLKSPLSFIRSVLDGNDYEGHEKKRIIEMSLLRIEAIAEQLHSKNEHIRKYDLYQMFNMLHLEKRALYSFHKKMVMSFEIPEDLVGTYPSAKFDHVITALSNIIDNAVEATNYIGEVNVILSLEKDDLTILVIDNGCGIPKEVVGSVYDKHFTYNKVKGTGLGLYQAKKAIESVSGTLQLLESSKSGTKFRIFIPNITLWAEKKTEQVVDNFLVNSINAKIEKPQNVILIDDDKFVRVNWSMHFHAIGIPFKSYSSVEEFLKDCESTDKNSYIYVDSSLGEDIYGEVESERIFKAGFTNIFITTGHDKDSIQKPHWIKEIFSKTPSNIW